MLRKQPQTRDIDLLREIPFGQKGFTNREGKGAGIRWAG